MVVRANEELLTAIESNDEPAVHALLAADGADVHTGHPLALAVLAHRHKLCAALLRAGADVLSTASGGLNSIHIAACTGDAQTLRLLVSAAPAAIDQPSAVGMTALMYAAAFGHVDACELLVEAGADARLNDSLRRSATEHTSQRESYLWRKGIEYRAWREELERRCDDLKGIGAGAIGGARRHDSVRAEPQQAEVVRPLLSYYHDHHGPETPSISLSRPTVLPAHAGAGADGMVSAPRPAALVKPTAEGAADAIAKAQRAAEADALDGGMDASILVSPLGVALNRRGESDLPLPVFSSLAFKRISTGALLHPPAHGRAFGELDPCGLSGEVAACSSIGLISEATYAGLHGVSAARFAGTVPARAGGGAARPRTAASSLRTQPSAQQSGGSSVHSAHGGTRGGSADGSMVIAAPSGVRRAASAASRRPPSAPAHAAASITPASARQPQKRGMGDPLQLEIRQLEDDGRPGEAVELLDMRMRLDRVERPKPPIAWRTVAERRPPTDPLVRTSIAVAGVQRIGQPLQMQSSASPAIEKQLWSSALPSRPRTVWAPHFQGPRFSRPATSQVVPTGLAGLEARLSTNPLQERDVVRYTKQLQLVELTQARAEGLRPPYPDKTLSQTLRQSQDALIAAALAAAPAVEPPPTSRPGKGRPKPKSKDLKPPKGKSK